MDAQTMEIGGIRSVFLRPVFAALVSCLIGVAACSKDEPADLAQSTGEQLPDQVISNFSITETTRTKKEWSLEAQKAYIYEKRNVLEAQLIKITFFDEGGGVRSVLTARRGSLDRNSNDMQAREDVAVTGADGVVLRTESLSWQNQKREIVSDDSVTVIRHGDTLTGWGFRGDADLTEFEILKNMRATIKSDRMEGEKGP